MMSEITFDQHEIDFVFNISFLFQKIRFDKTRKPSLIPLRSKCKYAFQNVKLNYNESLFK